MKHDWALLIGFGVAITGCCGALGYAVSGDGNVTVPLLAGLAFLVTGQVALLVMIVRQGDSFNDRLVALSRSASELRAELRSKTEQAFTRIRDVQSESRSRTETVIGGISDLKTSYSALRQSLAEQVANVHVRQQEEAAPVSARREAEQPVLRAGIDSSLSDHLSFALEPIVDMRNRRTAHYRLHMSMPLGRVEVGGNSLLDQISRSGLRPQLDGLAVDESLGLLAKLRQRDPELCIIMPVGPETLADPRAVDRIVNASLDAGSAAQGLVFELKHSMLPLLTPGSLEGLAQLSRQGQSFALSDASPAALDLAAMKTLHVRVVGLDAGDLRQMGGFDAAAQFSKQARLHGVSSLITGVEDASLIKRLAQITPLACGPCFASPRRVKRLNQGEDKGHKLGQAA